MRRLFTASVTLILALGVNVTPVAAHSTCSAGEFCVWESINYVGPEHEHFGTNENDWPLFGMENDDDSVKNNEAYRVRVFADSGYVNVEYCTQSGEVEDDINDSLDNDGDSNLQDNGVPSCGALPRP